MYIFFDIGGTKMRIARSRDGETFDEPLRFDTPASYDEGIALLIKTAQDLSAGEKIDAVAGGIAGTLDPTRTHLVHATHLVDWVQKPIHEQLMNAWGTPVYMENDSAVVGLGEANYGAGQGGGIVAYITVSTGIGGARLIDGTLDVSGYSFEPGDQIIATDEGGKGISVEDLVSGTALERRFGKKPYAIEDPVVWEELARLLAYALYNTILHWTPAVVVLGGPMVVGKPAISVDQVQDQLKTLLSVYPTIPQIRQATLKDIGGIYGACALLKTKNTSKNI
jgi:glucokinase